MKHTKHEDRKSFKKWAVKSITAAKQLHKQINHVDSNFRVYRIQTIVLK